MLKITQPHFTWTHLHNTTPSEIKNIQKEYDFHELIMEDMTELSGENKVDFYEEDNAVVLLLNFPRYDTVSERYVHNPFVCIVSEKYIITASKYVSKAYWKVYGCSKSKKLSAVRFFYTDIWYRVWCDRYDVW
jgi:Mg2+ and Co2+ transporter CorA